MEHTNILICDNNPLQYPTALDLLRDDLKIMTAVQKKNDGWPKSQNYISWPCLTQSTTTDPLHWVVENHENTQSEKAPIVQEEERWTLWSPTVMDRGYSIHS